MLASSIACLDCKIVEFVPITCRYVSVSVLISFQLQYLETDWEFGESKKCEYV